MTKSEKMITGAVEALVPTAKRMKRPGDKTRLAECIGGIVIALIAVVARFLPAVIPGFPALGDIPFTVLLVLGFAGFDRRIFRDYLRLRKSGSDAVQ